MRRNEAAIGRRASEHADAILGWLEEQEAAMVEFLLELARIETPAGAPGAHRSALGLIAEFLQAEGFRTRAIGGVRSGGCLYARPRVRPRHTAPQLLLAHVDTVWPVGTIAHMPVERRGNRVVGPGVFDMKGGIVQALFALRALRRTGLQPDRPVVFLVTSDEETGSDESRRWIERLARVSDRAFVLEPPHGPSGALKTSRKGVGRFQIEIRGRAAHAGLDPDAGASAVRELGAVIGKLYALHDPEGGVTVNVAPVSGGSRPNVVAESARAEVDVRLPDDEAAERVFGAIRRLRPEAEGVELRIEGGLNRPPLVRNPRNRALWERARRLGEVLGMQLGETAVGGASDGNLTSPWTATLDGLGAVGGGAHARDEFVDISQMARRAALLALLLLDES